MYLNKNKRKNQINFLENSIGCSLASILYKSHQYLWNNEIISSKSIFNKYIEYIRMKYGENDKYLFDINNTKNILEFIYFQINTEFTFAKIILNKNKNNNDYNKNSNIFFDEFKRNNKSIISDAFTGFYQYISFNSPNKNFKNFSFIKFNLDEINQFYDLSNANEININHFYSNINIYNCFDYTFKDKKHSIHSFPKNLTIILSQTDKCNFILDHEINLASYTNNFSNDNNGSYLLTSILCQMSYNKKFIIYFFDQKNGSWFSLSDQEMKKVDSIDINAIPLILIYQLKNTFQQVYNEIKIKDKLCAIIKFQGGMFQTTQLFFDQGDNIRNVRKKIKYWFDIKESFTLLINGRVTKDNESLSKVLEKEYNFLVIPKSN